MKRLTWKLGLLLAVTALAAVMQPPVASAEEGGSCFSCTEAQDQNHLTIHEDFPLFFNSYHGPMHQKWAYGGCAGHLNYNGTPGN